MMTSDRMLGENANPALRNSSCASSKGSSHGDGQSYDRSLAGKIVLLVRYRGESFAIDMRLLVHGNRFH